MNKKFLKWCESLDSMGFCGSLSCNLTETEKDEIDALIYGNLKHSEIHKTLYDLDPEYKYIAVLDSTCSIHFEDIPVISNDELIEDAVLSQGIAHVHAYQIQETNEIVCFAYSQEELNNLLSKYFIGLK